jgi:uncharacterized membrane protein
MVRGCLALMACVLPSLAGAQDVLMTPGEIKAQWSGKKLFGRSATGGLMDVQLLADGTATVSIGNSYDTGTWRLSADGYCVTWKQIRAGQERCFTVIRKGNLATVLNPDKTVSAEILRIVD